MNNDSSFNAPPIIATPQRFSKWWLLAILPLAGALLVLFLFNPSKYGFYPRCTLYVVTGLYCPGCGALRATHQLVHGHILAAMRCNLLLVLAVPMIGYFSLRQIICSVLRKPAPPFVVRTSWLIAFGVVLTLFTVLRNIHVAPFTYLAPP